MFLCFRLKPFTSYQFRVKATNDIGDSDYSDESEAITTLQDGKTINHVLFHCNIKNYNTISITTYAFQKRQSCTITFILTNVMSRVYLNIKTITN